MTIETEDLQALDLLSSPKAMVVRLRRCVKYHADTGKAVDSFAWKDEISHYDLATWWPADEAAGTLNTTRRHLQGELHLKADLKPSSAIAHFRVEVSSVPVWRSQTQLVSSLSIQWCYSHLIPPPLKVRIPNLLWSPR